MQSRHYMKSARFSFSISLVLWSSQMYNIKKTNVWRFIFLVILL